MVKWLNLSIHLQIEGYHFELPAGLSLYSKISRTVTERPRTTCYIYNAALFTCLIISNLYELILLKFCHDWQHTSKMSWTGELKYDSSSVCSV